MGAATGYVAVMYARRAMEEREKAAAEHAAQKEEQPALTAREERTAFLTAAQAQPTTKEAFALWYSVFLAQNPSVEPNLVEGIDYPDPLITDMTASSMQFWTPTIATPIPALPEAAPLRLLVITPHIYEKTPKAPREREPSRQNWGMNTLLFLNIKFRNGKPVLRATTNEFLPVQTYASVEAHRQGKSVPELLEAMYNAEPR